MLLRILLTILCSNLSACCCFRNRSAEDGGSNDNKRIPRGSPNSPELTTRSSVDPKIQDAYIRNLGCVLVTKFPNKPEEVQNYIDSIISDPNKTLDFTGINKMQDGEVCMVQLCDKGLGYGVCKDDYYTTFQLYCLIQMHKQHLRWVGADLKTVDTPLASHISFWKNYINKHGLTMDYHGRVGYPMSSEVESVFLHQYFDPETSAFFDQVFFNPTNQVNAELGNYIKFKRSNFVRDVIINLAEKRLYTWIDRCPGRYIFAWKQDEQCFYIVIHLENNRFILIPS